MAWELYLIGSVFASVWVILKIVEIMEPDDAPPLQSQIIRGLRIFFISIALVVVLVAVGNSTEVITASQNEGSTTRDVFLEQNTMFSEKAVAERRQEIDLVSTQGTSVLRDIKDTTGSGNIPSNPQNTGELMLETGTTINSTAELSTANLGRYKPGNSAQVGIGIRTLERPTGEQQWKAGYFDNNSGFFFGENSSCFYVALRKGGQTWKTCREDFNGENITEALNRDWNITDGAILQIDYSWYGYGAIRYSIVDTENLSSAEVGNVQKTVTVHTETTEGNSTVDQPFERIRVKVENGGTAENYEVRVGGRQYSVYGPESNTRRITNGGVVSKTVNSSDFQCLMAFEKSSNTSLTRREIKFAGFRALSSSENVELSVFYNANITTTGDFTSPNSFPADETALRLNKNCTFQQSSGADVGFDTPGGLEVWSDLIAAGGQGNQEGTGSVGVQDVNVKIPVERGVTLGARSLSGASTDVDANVRFLERK